MALLDAVPTLRVILGVAYLREVDVEPLAASEAELIDQIFA